MERLLRMICLTVKVNITFKTVAARDSGNGF